MSPSLRHGITEEVVSNPTVHAQGTSDITSDAENCLWLREDGSVGPEQVALPFSHGERARHLALEIRSITMAAQPSSFPSIPLGSSTLPACHPSEVRRLHVEEQFQPE